MVCTPGSEPKTIYHKPVLLGSLPVAIFNTSEEACIYLMVAPIPFSI